MNSASQICKDMIKQSNVSQRDVAKWLGSSECSLSNKFRRNSLSADLFLMILDYAGYEVKYVRKETETEAHVRTAGKGEHLVRIVNGVRYDTAKANAICCSEESDDVFYELYCDFEGRYFVAHYVKWEGGVSSISPIGKEDAEKIMKKYGCE